MPMHDWTKAAAGNYHGFHQLWIAGITNILNLGILPSTHYAQVEKDQAEPEPKVVALPNLHEIATEEERYANKANRIAVRHSDKTRVAIIEIVSPGNKSNKRAFDKFIRKAVSWIERGIHLLVIDPYPPTRREPLGLHRAIWDNFDDHSKFKPKARKNRILASYDAGIPKSAHVEPFGVGDLLMEMPLFLFPGEYVNVPLEKTYAETWMAFPRAVRREVE